MAYEHKPGNGSAFINKDKTQDWHADFKGDILLADGKLYWLDVTRAKTQAGDEFFKVKIGKEKAIASPPLTSHNQAKGNGYQPQPAGDEIPF
jgi:hypothetical protein